MRRAQNALAQPVHRNIARAAQAPRNAGFGQRHWPRGDEIARAGPRRDQARIFQPVVGLHHRALRHAALAGQFAYRGHARAAPQGAIANEFGHLRGDLQIQRR